MRLNGLGFVALSILLNVLTWCVLLIKNNYSVVSQAEACFAIIAVQCIGLLLIPAYIEVRYEKNKTRGI